MRLLQILAIGCIVAIIAAVLSGCAGSIVPGLRLAPDESQKQSADAADCLAGRLAATGARPGSPAALALAKMTRPAAAYAGRPKTPIDLEPLAAVEAGQWRHKDDMVRAAGLRDDLRARAMDIAVGRMADLASILAEKNASTAAILDRFAAIATVSQMADDLAGVIPDPSSPDETRSPEAERIAAAAAKAAETISAAASAAAVKRPDAATVIDKTLDAAEATAGKIVETKDRLVDLVAEYAPEAAGLLALFGVGGYAVKKRRDARVAADERDRAKHDELNARIAAKMGAPDEG